ncbi:MAG: hypothetical protein ACFCUH_10385 [Flavobacteriales bacterium]
MLYWTAPPTTAYCDINLYGLVQGAGGQVEDILLSVTSVSGLNYHFLDHSRFAFFENNPVFLGFHGDLVAYDSNGAVLGTEPFDIGDDVEIVQGPDGNWVSFYEGCSVTCDGPNYAWRIQQFVHPNNGSANYQFERAFRLTTSEVTGWPSTAPYYEYMGLEAFKSACTVDGEGHSLTIYATNWYGVLQEDWGWPNSVGLNGFAPRIIRVPNIGVFRDAYGYIISPVLHNEIVGIQKIKGQWDGPFIQVGPYVNPTAQCVQVDNSWMNLINFSDEWNDEFTTDLTCVGSWYDGEVYDTEDVWCAFWNTEGGDILTYDPDFGDAYGWDEIFFNDIMGDCPDAPSFAGIDAVKSFFNFLPDSGSINSVVITKMGKQGPEPYLHLDYKAFFDVNNMFKGFSHTFERGIYSLMMITQQGQPVFRMLDVRGNMTISGTYADFIDVNVFPVPITGNTYQISLLSPLQTRVNYILADANGTVLHRQLLSLEGGEQGTFRMAPRSGVPSGVHVHRFEFADGSYTTVTSTK